MMHTILRMSGLSSVTLGLFMFNYTTDGKASHHRVWALEHGFPEPSNALFQLGLAAVILGTLVLFFCPRKLAKG